MPPSTNFLALINHSYIIISTAKKIILLKIKKAPARAFRYYLIEKPTSNFPKSVLNFTINTLSASEEIFIFCPVTI